MAKIEKLERIFMVWPDPNGVYRVRADLVSYETARAREDALLGAAKESLKCMDCKCGEVNCPHMVLREVVRQIEETR